MQILGRLPLGMVLACWMQASALQAEPVTFDAQIKPILQRYCVECHSGWFPASGLGLESREELLAGGKQGKAVIPGQPDKGWLINMVTPIAGNPSRMPPGPQQLSPVEIDLIKQWIAAGAR